MNNQKIGFYLYQIGVAVAISGLFFLVSGMAISPLVIILISYGLCLVILVASVQISLNHSQPIWLGLVTQFLSLALIAGLIILFL